MRTSVRRAVRIMNLPGIALLWHLFGQHAPICCGFHSKVCLAAGASLQLEGRVDGEVCFVQPVPAAVLGFGNLAYISRSLWMSQNDSKQWIALILSLAMDLWRVFPLETTTSTRAFIICIPLLLDMVQPTLDDLDACLSGTDHSTEP